MLTKCMRCQTPMITEVQASAVVAGYIDVFATCPKCGLSHKEFKPDDRNKEAVPRVDLP